MKRSAGVTVIAVLALVGSAFTLLVGVGMLVAVAIVPAPESTEFPGSPMLFRIILVFASLMYLLPAARGIFTGIGLLRLKNWARISTIVFSVLLILMGGFTALMSLIVPLPVTTHSDVDPAVMSGIRMASGAFWLTLLGIGIWWVVYFNRPKVKHQFGHVTVMGESIPQPSPLQAPLEPYEPATSNRPLSITIIAWFLLAGCVFIPLSLLLHAPAMLFTKLLTGWSAVLLFLVLAVSQLCIGIGLLRLWSAARVAAIVYFCFGFVNTAFFYFAPGGHARMLALVENQQSMFPWMRLLRDQAQVQFDPLPSLVLGGTVGLLAIAIPVY